MPELIRIDWNQIVGVLLEVAKKLPPGDAPEILGQHWSKRWKEEAEFQGIEGEHATEVDEYIHESFDKGRWLRTKGVVRYFAGRRLDFGVHAATLFSLLPTPLQVALEVDSTQKPFGTIRWLVIDFWRQTKKPHLQSAFHKPWLEPER